MMIGRHVVHLLYADEQLNAATSGVGKKFVEAFRTKLAACVDDEDLLLEWGVAAILDPQQKTLGKFWKIWDSIGTKWLGRTHSFFQRHDAFVKEVQHLVIEYA